MMLEMRPKSRREDERGSPQNNDLIVWSFDEGGLILLYVSHASVRVAGRVLLVQDGWVARSVSSAILNANGIMLQKSRRNAVIALLNGAIPAPSDKVQLLADYDAFEASLVHQPLSLEHVARLAAIQSLCRPAEDDAGVAPSDAQSADDSTSFGHEPGSRSRRKIRGQER